MAVCTVTVAVEARVDLQVAARLLLVQMLLLRARPGLALSLLTGGVRWCNVHQAETSRSWETYLMVG